MGLTLFCFKKEFIYVIGGWWFKINCWLAKSELQVICFKFEKIAQEGLKTKFQYFKCEHIYKSFNQEVDNLSKSALLLLDGRLVVKDSNHFRRKSWCILNLLLWLKHYIDGFWIYYTFLPQGILQSLLSQTRLTFNNKKFFTKVFIRFTKYYLLIWIWRK